MSKELEKQIDVNTEVERINRSKFEKIFPHLSNPAVGAPKSVFLRGVHGVGKSSIIRSLCEQDAEDRGLVFVEMGHIDPLSVTGEEKPAGYTSPAGKVWWNPSSHYVFYDIRISQRDFVDFIGSVDQQGDEGNRVTRFAPVDWVRLYSHPEASGCIFFDEADRGTILVRQAVFEAVHDRRINSNDFSGNVFLIAAGNSGVGLDHIYDSTPMDAALTNRFITYHFHPTTKEWLDWARSMNAPGLDLVADFIDQYPEALDYPEEADADSDAILPTRRGWGDVGRLISRLVEESETTGKLSTEVIGLISGGIIGKTMASKFTSWCENERSLTLKDVLDGTYKPGRKVRPAEAIAIFRDAAKDLSRFVKKNKDGALQANKDAIKLTSFIEDVYEDNREIAALINTEMMSLFTSSKDADIVEVFFSKAADSKTLVEDGPFHHLMAAVQTAGKRRKKTAYEPRYSDYAKRRREENEAFDKRRKEQMKDLEEAAQS